MTRLSLSTASPATAKADALVVAACTGAGRTRRRRRRRSPTRCEAAGAGRRDRQARLGDHRPRRPASSPPIGSSSSGSAAAPEPATGRRCRTARAGPAGGRGRVPRRGRPEQGRLHPAAIDLTAAAEGHLLGAYVFDRYKKPGKAPVAGHRADRASAAKAAKDTLARAVITAEAVAFARDLINTAPNDLPPAVFADRAAAAGQEAGLTVEVLDEKALAKAGYGGILGVGVRLHPAAAAGPDQLHPGQAGAKVALVGKGITFDSGGISIKPAAKMDQMTSDMSGAAAVVATVVAAARLDLPVAVTAYAALAENLPSGSAYRPGDVLRHYGGVDAKGKGTGTGKTVHVLNTDAEGRLVLADAIVRACEDEPDYLLETSTLTGAQVVALGKRTMGVMGTPELRDRVAELGPAGRRGRLGDAAARAPAGGAGLAAGRPAEHRRRPGRRHAGRRSLPGRVRRRRGQWAHLDIAGPSFNDGKALRLHRFRRHRGAGADPAGRPQPTSPPADLPAAGA